MGWWEPPTTHPRGIEVRGRSTQECGESTAIDIAMVAIMIRLTIHRDGGASGGLGNEVAARG